MLTLIKFKRFIQKFTLASSALIIMFLTGCGGSGRAAPVDPTRARDTLRIALESWQKGESPEALKSASPSIVVQDFDWLGGQRLLAYEVTGAGKDDDANLRIPVKLTLKNTKGQEVKKTVSYVVGTSPVLTVFRDFH